jgi:hypothetical protein
MKPISIEEAYLKHTAAIYKSSHILMNHSCQSNCLRCNKVQGVRDNLERIRRVRWALSMEAWEREDEVS